MEFISSVPDYNEDLAINQLWDKLKEIIGDKDGLCYYKHPIIHSMRSAPPDLSILIRNYKPIAIKCINCTLEDIKVINHDHWTISDAEVDSPELELEDFQIAFRNKFEEVRQLRKINLKPLTVLFLPLISEKQFYDKFSERLSVDKIIWNTYDIDNILQPLIPDLSTMEWSLALSVYQAAIPLNRNVQDIPKTKNKLGPAIKELVNRISIFDTTQLKGAIQIPPGPQRIRGLAGTGKTILLTAKAANIHNRFPDKKMLFTFNTQTLYNQTYNLISKFFWYYKEMEPDWKNLHVQHAWGSLRKEGVYSNLCKLQERRPLKYMQAKMMDPEQPFRACCLDALKYPIPEIYDFVLVDEGQDFPPEFFKLLYKLTKSPKCIYWASDSLQSLNNLSVPEPDALFGSDDKGNPLVSLKGMYPGYIEKDLVLSKSYRCPTPVLMVAHAIGLGLYRPNGCVQMLTDESWRSIGYKIEGEKLIPNEIATIVRPPESSFSFIEQVYTGPQNLVIVKKFNTPDEEYDWVVQQIKNDISEEGVLPEQIIVISLKPHGMGDILKTLRTKLVDEGISSTLPGIINFSDEFAEAGRTTLSTVFRAKGNESPIVYIMGANLLYDYTEELIIRNMAFTSISRAMGWVRITGHGIKMDLAEKEIQMILKNIPKFIFKYPIPSILIRQLQIETDRRKRIFVQAEDSLEKLIETEEAAIKDMDPEKIKRLKEKLEKLLDETE